VRDIGNDVETVKSSFEYIKRTSLVASEVFMLVVYNVDLECEALNVCIELVTQL
jgi:hypothetical protein